MRNAMNRFSRSQNPGNVTCPHCGRLTWAGRAFGQAESCVDCYDDFGRENEHLDGYHADRFVKLCPICAPEAAAERLAARKAHAAKTNATRAATLASRLAAKPHCPNCGDERPKTRATERGERPLCSGCKNDLDVRYFLELGRRDLAAESVGNYLARRNLYGDQFTDEALANELATKALA
jgi:ssDNA-binding Zn-finger/Zn-ribbon topoisomerase 1